MTRHRTTRAVATGLIAGALWPLAASAQDVAVGLQVRPRYEYRSPAPLEPDGFTSMRVRVDLTGRLPRHASAFVQVQDVRLWGEETSTLTDFRSDNFDLHQAYIGWQSDAAGSWSARIGRQAVALGEERVIGAVEWTQQGRAFDGVRVTARHAGASLDLFGFKLSEASAAAIPRDAELAGAYGQLPVVAGASLDGYALFNRVAGVDTRQGTVGLRFAGRRSAARYRAEAAYQFGRRDSLSVSAALIALEAGVTFAGDRGVVLLMYDYLSGDRSPLDRRATGFETLFATNHKFYGYADLFTDIPTHTGRLGLQDGAVKVSFAPVPDARLALDVHTFHLARRGTLGSRHLAEELDLTASYRHSANLSVTAGWSWVIDGPAIRALGRLTEDLTFVYLMLDARM